MISESTTWAERSAALFPPAAARHTDLVISSAQGAFVKTTDGRELLDFASGVAVTNVGHGHPQVIAAAKRQLDTLLHAGHNVAVYPPYIELAEQLVDLVGGDHKVYFSNSGAEALEGAVKLAARVTGRSALIAFKRAFHGRTLTAAALTASSSLYRRHYGALMPTVHHVDYPAPFAHQASEASEVDRCLRELDDLFSLIVHPSDVAAIVVEPFQGEGGYQPAPAAFLAGLRQRADAHDIVLVYDEIQSGFGRTGTMFAWEDSNVQPDALVLAKGIANGFPLSAVVARSQLMDQWDAGAHGGTFGGNPVACAAALAVIDVLRNGALSNAAAVGEHLKSGLEAIVKDLPLSSQVRGRGVMIGMELRTIEDHLPASSVVSSVIAHARALGLIVVACGTEKNVLRLMPPTTLTVDEADQALQILSASFTRALA